MKRALCRLLTTLGAFSPIGVFAVTLPEPGSESNDYRLVWSDEFQTDGAPDPNHWTFETGFVRNEELQWYQKDNARCRDGLLTISARRETVRNPSFASGSDDWRRSRRYARYTSACVKTKDRVTFRYGMLEVRARMDARPGLWPAIWTLGAKRRWPECGEVDLFEYYDHRILANACWLDRSKKKNPVWDSTKRPLQKFGDRDWAKQFHIWQMIWDERQMKLLLDDQTLNTIELDKVPQQADGFHPFRQPHYILLNLAIGGNRGGDPSRTSFPAEFVVDYVRIYQRKKP